MLVRAARLDEIIALRHAVLRPGRPLDTAMFEGDDEPGTIHVGAFDGDRLVCCATVMRRPYDGEDALQLRGMATVADRTRQGAGTAVVRYLETQVAAAHGVRLLWCNARTSASGFYARAGWAIVSPEFDIPDVGPHVRMIRRPV